jgi:hypothetical protein
MKNPLSYQATEYDCGPTSIRNGISYLFNREEIPPDIIKAIMMYCLDGYNKKGEAGKKGTSAMAVVFLSSWFNQFGKMKRFPISSEVLDTEDIYISRDSKIAECLQQGGAAVVGVMLGCWHYVLLTDIDDEYVYLFDPYYRKNPFREDGVDIITDSPTKMNRRVKHSIMNSLGKANYSMGAIENRECMLIYNTNTRKTIDNIEYFI